LTTTCMKAWASATQPRSTGARLACSHEREAPLAEGHVRPSHGEGARTPRPLLDLERPGRATARDAGGRAALERARVPGRVSVHAGHPAHDVPRTPLDDAPVRGVRLRGGVE